MTQQLTHAHAAGGGCDSLLHATCYGDMLGRFLDPGTNPIDPGRFGRVVADCDALRSPVA